MKKFMTELLILAVLFCFTACKHEPDSTPTPDLTTLDGMYVITYNTAGKLCNQQTLIISGDTAIWYILSSGFSNASLNGATQEIFDGPNTIVRNGLSFYEVGYEDDVYTLEVQNGVGLLTESNSPTVYQKVLPGQLGESQLNMDVYLSGDGAEGCDSVSIATMSGVCDVMFYSGTDDKMYTGQVSEGTAENVYTVTNTSKNFSYTVTVSGNTVTVSAVTGTGITTPPASGAYTRYVRTTPWPTVSAN